MRQTGDFNSQPQDIPIQILRTHGGVSDSFLDTHPNANTATAENPQDALKSIGMTCDSSLNTYSNHKGVPEHIMNVGGKRLDYIFHRQPEIARRRPLIWGHRDGQGQNGDQLEEGKPMDKSIDQAPTLKCVNSEVVLTDRISGGSVSYSDHFGLCSTFLVETPNRSNESSSQGGNEGSGTGSFSPLLDQDDPNPSVNSLPNSNISPQSSRNNNNKSAKSTAIRTALHTLRLYTRTSQTTAKVHLRLFAGAIVALLALTIGSAWQPKSWLQPIFTLLGGAIGAGGATMLYLGFVWGRWELGLLTEVTEEMELELRVSEMEDTGQWS
jgi:sphingomyelin phosphodiesterase 2